MKRITYWTLSTVSALVLMFGYHTSTSSSMASTAEHSTATSTSSTAASSPSSTAAASTSSSSASSSSGTTVTGTAVQTRYGPVQVKLTITSGKITAVDVVEYPDSNGRDEEINSQAVPILVSETLKAQNATIDMVSGATYTSTGYLSSLQSALDQAGL